MYQTVRHLVVSGRDVRRFRTIGSRFLLRAGELLISASGSLRDPEDLASTTRFALSKNCLIMTAELRVGVVAPVSTELVFMSNAFDWSLFLSSRVR